MTERGSGSGGVEDNVRDDLEKTQRKGKKAEKDATREAVEAEEKSGQSGVKDNVRDEWEETQRH